MAMFGETCVKSAVPPHNLVKTVESASRVWPPRVAFGGMLMHELNARFPAAVERMRTGHVDRLHGHSDPVHQRARVLAEARLAWSEVAAVGRWSLALPRRPPATVTLSGDGPIVCHEISCLSISAWCACHLTCRLS
jgi:hypothetical protein